MAPPLENLFPDTFLAQFPLTKKSGDNGQHPLDSFELAPLSQLEDGEFAGDDPALIAMVDVEDAQIEADFLFTDVRDDKLNSAKEKEKNALKHFNYFLMHHAKQRETKFVVAEDLAFEATESNIGWWDDAIGCFFTYLAKYACHRCDLTKDRISYNTATQYASSVKAYYSNKFRLQKHSIPVFEDRRWKALRVRLLAAYEEDNRSSGKSLVNPHEASSRQDCEAISTGCIWMNSPGGAQFFHLNITMRQYSGRGSEVALDVRFKMGVAEICELTYQYYILQPKLKRHKLGKEQLISIFPHRETLLLCYYFSLLYRIVMMGDDSDYIFSDFAKRALKQTESKSDSKVSSLWSSYFTDLYKSFVGLASKMNKALTSHCHKKGANQSLMAETPGVSGLAQIFRTGWEVCEDSTPYLIILLVQQ